MIKVWIGTGIFMIVAASVMAYMIVSSNWDDGSTTEVLSEVTETMDLASKTKQDNLIEEAEEISYHSGSTLLIDQESFVGRFNLASETFKIDKVEEINKKNNLLFTLTSSNEDSLPLYYLTAINNPEKDQLVQVSLSITGVDGLSATFKEEDWLTLANATYYALESSEEGRFEFAEQLSFKDEESETDEGKAKSEDTEVEPILEKIKQKNWRNKQHDIYTDRTEEGAVLGIYPAHTFSHYVLEKERLQKTEESKKTPHDATS